MIDHDRNIGEILGVLDDLKIADDTMVVYTTEPKIIQTAAFIVISPRSACSSWVRWRF
jgi:hypothetical protein